MDAAWGAIAALEVDQRKLQREIAALKRRLPTVPHAHKHVFCGGGPSRCELCDAPKPQAWRTRKAAT